MKIDVKKSDESKEAFIPNKKSLINYIKKNKENIHNLIGAGGCLLGADHDIKSVIDDINNYTEIYITIGKVKRKYLNHSLIIMKDNINLYDIGEITIDNLNIKSNN